MRRMSLALIALGAFLIVLAPMVRWYAYPRLAVAPANQRSITTLVAKNAEILDISTLKNITTDLTTKVRTTGDANTPKACPGAVTYVNSTSTVSSDGVMRSRQVERMTFDQISGEARPNCGNDFISTVEGNDTPVKHEGLVAKFPFETQKKSYDFWDSTLLKAFPIAYAGTATVDGVATYVFHQTIDPTQYGTQNVPLSLLGLTGATTVDAAEMYSVDRTLWVEPNTGVILKRAEAQTSTLDYNGAPRLTLSKATVGYDDPTVKANADKYGAQGSMLHLVRSTGPQLAFVLGLISLGIGIVLGRRKMQTGGGSKVRELADSNH